MIAQIYRKSLHGTDLRDAATHLPATYNSRSHLFPPNGNKLGVMLTKLRGYVNPFALLRQQPVSQPLCAFSCGAGRYFVIAQRFTTIPFTSVRQQLLRVVPQAGALPFTRGIVGLVSYDQFAARPMPVLSRFFRVEAALIFDLHTSTVWQSGAGGKPLPDLPTSVPPPSRRLNLQALANEADYLATVRQIVTDIRDGRYYLLNFLRFFQVTPCVDDDLLCRLAHSRAPCRAVIWQEDFKLYSFSPEQFVSLRSHQGHTELICTPIKGTAARHADAQADQLARQALQCSAKDLAELHITVDLARNDINRIAQVGSTQVCCAAQVQSFATVHHLVGTITARLREDVTLEAFLQALCPAASISGAPKLEVMRAIASYETRARGFFMGNIISIDASGRLDASVLIRTLVVDAEGAIYAAGGGIVLDSDPRQERQEIETKLQTLLCR